MLGNIVTKIVLWMMRNTRFSLENRVVCTTALLDKLNAIPSRDIVNIDGNGSIFVNGKAVDKGKVSQMRQQAQALLENPLRQFVREQVSFRAVKLGVHKANDLNEVFFSKAALYQAQQEDEIYEQLAQK